MEDKTAKVVRFHAIGGPEVLKIEDEPIPEPAKRRSSSERESNWIEQGRGDVPQRSIPRGRSPTVEARL